MDRLPCVKELNRPRQEKLRTIRQNPPTDLGLQQMHLSAADDMTPSPDPRRVPFPAWSRINRWPIRSMAVRDFVPSPESRQPGKSSIFEFSLYVPSRVPRFDAAAAVPSPTPSKPLMPTVTGVPPLRRQNWRG
jgi:hypothetical protein